MLLIGRPWVSRSTRRTSLATCAVVIVTGLLVGAAANAATIQVNSNSSTVANDGLCTLREAVTAVNTRTRSGSASGECVAGNGSSDIIQLMTSTQTYSLTTTLAINRSVQIAGYGTAVSIIRSTAMRVFEVIDLNTSEAGPIVSMSFLTIENGRSDSNIVTGIYFGGDTGGARLTLNSMIIRNCSNGVRAIGGGHLTDAVSALDLRIENSKSDGFYCSGCSANLQRTVITGSAGSGVRNRSLAADGWPASGVALTDSTIENNGSTSANGGGIYTEAAGSATVNLTRCTVSGNRGANGGGIYNQGSLIAAYTTTISGNTASRGAGVYIDPASGNTPGENNFFNSTLSRNTASIRGGGIYVAGRQAFLKSTIIAANTDNGSGTKSPDCVGDVSIGAGSDDTTNMIGNETGCNVLGDGAWLFVGDVKLGPLVSSGAQNGAKVHIPLKGSPAINALFLDTLTDDDQRGMSRPEPQSLADGTLFQGFVWDVGAAEYNETWPNTELNVAAYSGDGMSVWDSNGYFRYGANATGDYITFAVPISEPGTYTITGHVGKARDGGNYRLEVANSLGGSYTSIMSQDLYLNTTTPSKVAMTSGTVTYGSVGFTAGLRYFRFRVLGKNASATGYLLRLSYLKVSKS
jgi:hypothetical protein